MSGFFSKHRQVINTSMERAQVLEPDRFELEYLVLPPTGRVSGASN